MERLYISHWSLVIGKRRLGEGNETQHSSVTNSSQA